MPAISVLVPIYNVERYLEECLASLAAQTFTDFEVLCINDGSTDGSRDIIQRYLDADPRFRVIDKPNSGYGASMNRGLAESRGAYVGILESDDFLEPNGLEALHSAAVAFDVDVVKANFWLYWSTPTERNEFHEAFIVQDCSRVVDPAEETKIFHAKPSIWSALYRRSFLTENGIDFLETPGASFQDLSFTFKVWACARRVVFLYNSYVHYRQDNENSSVNSMGKVDAVFNEYAEIGRWLGEHPELEDKFATVKAKMMYDSCIWNYERVAEKHKVELLIMTRDAFLAEQKAGHLDIREFEPWKLTALQTIMWSPAAYHQERVKGESTTAKVVRVLTQGSARDIAGAAKRQVAKIINRSK
ncbi:glycosyltransferase [Propioniciclava coleopterorum]|uniref:Glycosyltransferase n=1 Tax=Propioniciclava coleopterorum TaxID=2714937 RepID=A0A6G7Y845_9ACTN|nr:glycosyltransferase [Propioniciclava coleopterorum]QIK73064.1 glycosyltransferase [Propioniciclava coleopterorum]